MNSPIVMNSGLLTMSQNQQLEPDSSRMQNPFRTPMLIDEIRIATQFLTIDPPISSFVGGQLFMRAEIWYGRTQLTRGFVPVGCLARGISTNTYTATSNFTWKLPKPIYVPPEELLVTKLKYDPTGLTFLPATMTAEVSYAGRSLASKTPKPETIHLPWATHFDLPIIQVVNGATSSTTSTPAQLLNPFDQPMHIQRFIGRSVCLAGFSNELNFMWPAKLAWTGTKVRAADSFGNILVRDPTPFGHLFQYTDRTWTVNSELAPKGYYLMQVDREYTITVPADHVGYLGHAIGMIGYRQVRL